MKQHKLLVSLLIVFLFIVGINGVSAKNEGEKCEEDKNCKEICSTTRGYIVGQINDGKELNYTTKIYQYDDGSWVVYVKNDEDKVDPFAKKGKWDSLFLDTDKVKILGERVYVHGITEEDLKNKKCPEHAHLFFKTRTFNVFKYQVHDVCFDNDNVSCSKMGRGFTSDTYTFDDDTGSAYVISEDGESVSRYENDRVIVPEPPTHDGDGCAGMFGEKVTEDINTALKIMRYIAPVLVIVLSILDFIKAVSSGDSGKFNDAWKKLLKRLIVALLLFFVVVLLKEIFKIFDIIPAADCIK